MPSRLSELLAPSRIALHLQSTKRTSALNETARLLEGHSAVTNFQGFFSELLARERLDTTCLGNGIALPHARTDHVERMVIAVGRNSEGIDFEHPGQVVKLLFVLGTPKSNPGAYLGIVSSLCKLLKESANRQKLLTVETPEEFIEAVKAIEATLPGFAPVTR